MLCIFSSRPSSVLYQQFLGCNHGIGGFHKTLVTFREPKFPQNLLAKSCASKNAVLRYNDKKAGESGSVTPKCKMVENLHRIDRQLLKIGLNPNFLGYSYKSRKGTNLHTSRVVLWAKLFLGRSLIYNCAPRNFKRHFLLKPNADIRHLLDSLVSALAVYATGFAT